MSSESISSGKKVATAAGFLMVTMLISRILGFVREQALGITSYGSSTDAYIAAFTIPDLLYNLLVAGGLSAAFIPVFTSYLARGEEEEASVIASTVINVIIITMLAGIGLGMIFTPALIPLVAYKFKGDTLALTIELTRIMLPAVLFTGLNGIFMGILNSYKHFLAPAIGSIIYNIAIIVMGVTLGPKIGVAGFAIGVVVGVLGNFAIQLPFLMKQGFRYRLILNLKHPGIIKLIGLMIPALIGLSVNQINLVINQNLASGLPEGSITALRFANRLMFLPLGIFAVSIGMAIFPTLSTHAARKEMKEFKKTMSLGIRSVIFLSLPAAAGLMALGVPIVRLLFEKGQFTHAATLATDYALFYYCIGLFAQASLNVIVRGFYALQDTITPVVIGFITIFLNFVLNLALIGPMAQAGLALAYSITGIFNMIVLLYFLRRKIGLIGGRQLFTSTGKMVAASLVMGLASYQTAKFLEGFLDLTSKANQAVQVGVAIGVGVLVYAVFALVLKMEEAQLVVGTLKRRFGR